jgi:hypothetical protein
MRIAWLGIATISRHSTQTPFRQRLSQQDARHSSSALSSSRSGYPACRGWRNAPPLGIPKGGRLFRSSRFRAIAAVPQYPLHERPEAIPDPGPAIAGSMGRFAWSRWARYSLVLNVRPPHHDRNEAVLLGGGAVFSDLRQLAPGPHHAVLSDPDQVR